MSQTAPTIDEIENIILSRSRVERERLWEALNASLDLEPELDPEWDEVIRRRIQEVESGTATLVPLADVLKAGDDLLRE